MEGVNQEVETNVQNQTEIEGEFSQRAEHLLNGQERVVEMLLNKGIMDKNGEVTGTIKTVFQPSERF